MRQNPSTWQPTVCRALEPGSLSGREPGLFGDIDGVWRGAALVPTYTECVV